MTKLSKSPKIFNILKKNISSGIKNKIHAYNYDYNYYIEEFFFFFKNDKLSNRKRKSGKLDMHRHVESIYTHKSMKSKSRLRNQDVYLDLVIDQWHAQ